MRRTRWATTRRVRPRCRRLFLAAALAAVVVATACEGVAATGGAAGAAVPAASSSKLQVVAAENFWGSIVEQLAGNESARDEHHHEPRHRPPRLRGQAERRRTIASAQLRDRERHRLRPLGPEAPRRRTRTRAARSSTSGKLVGIDAGGNPHQWYSPDTVQQCDRSGHRRPQAPGPDERRLLRRAEDQVRVDGAEAVQRPDRRHQAEVRGHPGRCDREHLRAARGRRSGWTS